MGILCCYQVLSFLIFPILAVLCWDDHKFKQVFITWKAKNCVTCFCALQRIEHSLTHIDLIFNNICIGFSWRTIFLQDMGDHGPPQLLIFWFYEQYLLLYGTSLSLWYLFHNPFAQTCQIYKLAASLCFFFLQCALSVLNSSNLLFSLNVPNILALFILLSSFFGV